MEATHDACPFLGLMNDAQTRYAMPDRRHACHRAEPAAHVTLEQQGVCCLTPGHTACPGVCQGWNGPLPAELRAALPRPSLLLRLRAVGMGAVVLLALGLLSFLVVRAAGLRPAPAVTLAGGLNPRTLTPTLTATASPAPTGTVTPRPTVMPSATVFFASSTPGPVLETPFGPDPLCLVHQVAEGEALEFLVAKYRTSVNVVRAVNDLPTSTLWVGSFLVLCPDRADAAGLPRLRPRFLEERVRVADLAAETGVDAAALRAWNALGADDWVEAKRWVVIPLSP